MVPTLNDQDVSSILRVDYHIPQAGWILRGEAGVEKLSPGAAAVVGTEERSRMTVVVATCVRLVVPPYASGVLTDRDGCPCPIARPRRSVCSSRG